MTSPSDSTSSKWTFEPTDEGLRFSKSGTSRSVGYERGSEWDLFFAEGLPPYPFNGKHLFFHPDRKVLGWIALEEVGAGRVHLAKMVADGRNQGPDFCLVLCAESADQGSDIQQRYRGIRRLRGPKWKTDEQTMRKDYSEKFKSYISPEERAARGL